MTKRGTSARPRQAPSSRELVSVQVPLPLLERLEGVRQGFFALCVETGRQVLEGMMESDRTAECGPKWCRDPARAAVRAGTTPSEITLGGRRIPIRRPRVRGVADGERALPSFRWAADRDPLDTHTLDAIALGVSTRGYARSLEPLPQELAERSVSRSATSSRFVALSQRKLRECLARPLSELDLRVVLIDGLHFREHCILVALGVSSDGRKHLLGLREGTTENTPVARALLEDLVERGLPADRALLWGVDGAKALRKAVAQVFGPLAVVQRCQVHKLRNVKAHLPIELQRSVHQAMAQAYATPDARLAERQLERLARSLERKHPGAAGSLREGLAETLTLQRLGVRGALYLTLRSTNPIENLNGAVARFTRNVKRWRDGSMILRWVGTAALEAEKHFRRLRGYRDMTSLVAALRQHETQIGLDNKEKAA
jgi:transposase-like protein